MTNPNHTDTSRSGGLVERLRDFVIAEDIDLAADRIEALEAEVERLRGALIDVLVYAPDYMHGMPKKHYEKIARGEQ